MTIARRPNAIAACRAGCLALLLAAGCTKGGAPGGDDAGSNDDAPPQADTPQADMPPADAAPADSPPADGGSPATCPDGAKPGKPGKTDNIKSPGGPLFNLRAPADYKATEARPLIVVYSPSGGDRMMTEPYTDLTAPALARGYIIAFVDHVDPNAGLKAASTVVDKVVADFCIDPKRIYLTGHSDGGSVANTIPILYATPRVAAIAPSAGGTNPPAGAPCPMQLPLPILIAHSKNDTTFPGYGAKVRAYHLKCQECGATPTTLANGCQEYGGCKGGAVVQFCEGTNTHSVYPKTMNAPILDFFDEYALP